MHIYIYIYLFIHPFIYLFIFVSSCIYIYICIYVYIYLFIYSLACSCRYPSTVTFRGQAAQLHNVVRSEVLIDLRLQFAVRSEVLSKADWSTKDTENNLKRAQGASRTAKRASQG